jgi:hypothetical protein
MYRRHNVSFYTVEVVRLDDLSEEPAASVRVETVKRAVVSDELSNLF